MAVTPGAAAILLSPLPEGGERPRVIGDLQQTPDELKTIVKQNDRNQVDLIARGNNVQIYPMKIEIRNVWLKQL